MSEQTKKKKRSKKIKSTRRTLPTANELSGCVSDLRSTELKSTCDYCQNEPKCKPNQKNTIAKEATKKTSENIFIRFGAGLCAANKRALRRYNFNGITCWRA